MEKSSFGELLDTVKESVEEEVSGSINFKSMGDDELVAKYEELQVAWDTGWRGWIRKESSLLGELDRLRREIERRGLSIDEKKKVPKCSKCGKKHQPFQKCSSKKKVKEGIVPNDKDDEITKIKKLTEKDDSYPDFVDVECEYNDVDSLEDKLRAALRQFGIYVYRDPRMEDSDMFALIFSKRQLSKKDLQQIVDEENE